MIIEEKDFRMTLCTGNLWDLELLQTIRPKGKPERQEFQIEGYGMSLENCMKSIINHRLSNKQDVYSLKEYIKEYKEELSKLKELFKEL